MNPKIGLICACYNATDYLERFLAPWFEYKLEGNPVEIVIIDSKFKETEDDNPNPNSNDGSLELLESYEWKRLIKLIKAPAGLFEHESRNLALDLLKKENVDLLWTEGIDELFKLTEIKNIVEFIKKDDLVCVFKINYKNIVFTTNQYLDGFAPSRIWKMIYNKSKLDRFFWDDDILYKNSEVEIRDSQMPFKTIPKSVANVVHETWLSNERSKQKVKYQEKHFAHGAGCGFKWNEEKNCLEFNEEHYRKIGQPIPEVLINE